ncbi:MAG: NADH-quinone oxidoreductase subunit N [Pirellulales bacterium]
MNYDALAKLVISETSDSLGKFLPEIVLCGTILVMLMLRISNRLTKLFPSWLLALAGAIIALAFCDPLSVLGSQVVPKPDPIFQEMLVYDAFTVFFRTFLLLFTVLFIILTKLTGIPDSEDGADFYTLVLGAVIGMCLMVSANHLLMVFLAVEMASVPSYVLAGMLKGRRESSEAALKYSIYGAGTAGVMLYGISLVSGVIGSAHLPTIATRLAEGVAGDASLVLVLGGLMIMVGLAFKLSAVPFHFWCPDVFEGACAEVNAFLSVASKAAALALLVRVAIGVTNPDLPEVAEPVAAVEQSGQEAGEQFVQPMTGPNEAGEVHSLADIRQFIAYVIAVIAAITCTFGNLAAYGQTNIKRLLAYSTIAHAGYMMMPVAAGVWLMNENPAAAEEAFASLLVYAGIYLFMNLGAFAIVAILRNRMFSEEIADYAGLIRTSPGIVVCFTAILFSLIGLPPLAGFLGKLVIFAGLVDAKMYTLLVIGGVNTVISLFYYLRVVKVMTFEPEPDNRSQVRFSLLGSLAGIYVVVITAPVILLIFQWSGLHEWSLAACQELLN